ncbi:MAG: hypothetical protein KatS3mg131_3792 [Candidatus Tectimicrobiota bacterium]|nr:MAG: hypothetical protein KatS3mg131_3792 [Candidatus Tectomicrobia bacterium]
MIEFSLEANRAVVDWGLRCPACQQSLRWQSATHIRCRGCGSDYPVYQGIPDFRAARRGFRVSATERERLAVLLDAFPHASFEELLRLRFSFSKGQLPEPLWQLHLRHELQYVEKGHGRRLRIERVLAHQGRQVPPGARWLDIGCGTGTSLPWLMAGCARGVGVDISLLDLLVGKKFFEERGIAHLGLVCADATCLPFAQATFELVNATDVIEHVVDGQEAFVRQLYRVLRPGGFGYFNSPNRYNLFGPEPHVQVWFVGFLPRRYMDAYVRRRRGVRYTSVRLLSYWELSRLLRRVCGTHYAISGPLFDPRLPATSRKARLIKACPWLLPLANRVAFYVITDYQVLVHKPHA